MNILRPDTHERCLLGLMAMELMKEGDSMDKEAIVEWVISSQDAETGVGVVTLGMTLTSCTQLVLFNCWPYVTHYPRLMQTKLQST